MDIRDGPQPCPPGGTLRFAIRPVQTDFDQISSTTRGSEGVFLYVFGIVAYQDVFGRDRLTRFCARFEPEPTNRVAEYPWLACNLADHNDST